MRTSTNTLLSVNEDTWPDAKPSVAGAAGGGGDGMDPPSFENALFWDLKAEVIQLDGSSMATIVSDLSLDGCSVAGWFRIGDTVVLEIPQIGKVQGQVRWAMRGKAGIRFQSSSEQSGR